MQVLEKAAEENWDATKLERLLKKCPLSADNKKILVLFWTNERDKVHLLLLAIFDMIL